MTNRECHNLQADLSHGEGTAFRKAVLDSGKNSTKANRVKTMMRKRRERADMEKGVQAASEKRKIAELEKAGQSEGREGGEMAERKSKKKKSKRAELEVVDPVQLVESEQAESTGRKSKKKKSKRAELMVVDPVQLEESEQAESTGRKSKKKKSKRAELVVVDPVQLESEQAESAGRKSKKKKGKRAELVVVDPVQLEESEQAESAGRKSKKKSKRVELDEPAESEPDNEQPGPSGLQKHSTNFTFEPHHLRMMYQSDSSEDDDNFVTRYLSNRKHSSDDEDMSETDGTADGGYDGFFPDYDYDYVPDDGVGDEEMDSAGGDDRGDGVRNDDNGDDDESAGGDYDSADGDNQDGADGDNQDGDDGHDNARKDDARDGGDDNGGNGDRNDGDDVDDDDEEDGVDARQQMRPKKKRQPKTPAADANPDDDDEEDGADARQQERPRKKRRPKTPAADANPDGPSKSTPKTTGWTKHLKRVRVHRYKPEAAEGPTFPKQDRPVDYFLMFFPLFLFRYIAKKTNINLAKADLRETSGAEIRAWFGIRLVMSICILADVDDYWSKEQGFRNGLITKTMKKKRFQDLSAQLACSNPDKDPILMPSTNSKESQKKFLFIRKHPLFYFQKVWNTVLDCCRQNYICKRELSIDEAMIPYRGFKAWCQKFFMPSKPVRAGFKVYALAEAASGYMANFTIHVPSSKPTKYADIAYDVASRHLGKYHHIFMDKLYTCVDLADKLFLALTYLTGAIRTNRTGLPKDMLFTPARNTKNLKAILELKKTPRGTFYARQQGSTTYILWNDSSLLSLLSTAHNAYRKPEHQVIRRYVAEGEANKIRQPHNVPAPPAVISYCEHMGGVDRADQLRAYHSVTRKSQNWWKHVLYFLIDIARVNAWICYKHHEGESPDLSHTHFIMKVATGLIDGFSHGVKTKLQRQAPAWQVGLKNFNGLHTSMPMGRAYARVCKQCSNDKRKTPSGFAVKSTYGCPTCKIHLCQGYCFAK